MNDSLYNPDSMSKEDIKTLFVARQPLLDEIVKTIKTQPKGAGVQHLLMIAPRGMGKTTMLLMVQFAVEDDKSLAKNWRAVRFPEENYDIADLADLWLKVLDYLDDESLKRKIAEVKNEFRDTENLREASWALVKDWSKANKKRIVLLLDNFDMILDQIGDVTEQARLRDVLMNDGTVMLIGGAASYFKEIQDYGQPLYNFFKTQNLSDLKFPEIEELLRRRAGIDAIPNIEELLEKNKTRIRALETFTGGNPRLVLMLYRIIISSDMTEVRDGLERLLDAITPFYKDKTEKLPPQQRKIINEIALYGLEKSEGISPTDIAKRIRMTANQVSTQLKRLLDNGYVKSLNVRGRSSLYALSEPLYSIWAQMRFGRNAREKRNWLVQILKALYDVQERQNEIERLREKVVKLKLDGDQKRSQGTIEYLMCLLETGDNFIHRNFRLAIESYIELNEISSIKSELTSEKLFELTPETLDTLFSRKLINESDFKKAKLLKLLECAETVFQEMIENKYDEEGQLREYQNAIACLEEALTLTDKKVIKDSLKLPLAIAYKLAGESLLLKQSYEDAELFLGKAIQLFTFANLKDESSDSAEIVADAYVKRSMARGQLLRPDDAISDCENAVVIYDAFVKSGEIQKFDLRKVGLAYFTKFLLKPEIEELEPTLLKVISLNSAAQMSPELNFVILAFAYCCRPQFLGQKFWSKLKEVLKKQSFGHQLKTLLISLDYLETKDGGLIERLSPEARLVVEETHKMMKRIEEESKEIRSYQDVQEKKVRASKKLALSK